MTRTDRVWEFVGRLTVFVMAWLLVTACLAVVRLYWTEVDHFIVSGLVTLLLIVLLFRGYAS